MNLFSFFSFLFHIIWQSHRFKHHILEKKYFTYFFQCSNFDLKDLIEIFILFSFGPRVSTSVTLEIEFTAVLDEYLGIFRLIDGK